MKTIDKPKSKPKPIVKKRGYTPSQLNRMPCHRLIDIALKDLNAVERLKSVKVDMSTYVGRVGGKCHVCFAGAVMYKECNWRSGTEFGVVPPFALALNDLRNGLVRSACFQLKRESKLLPLDRYAFAAAIPSYKDSPTAFKFAMKKLQETLQKAGI